MIRNFFNRRSNSIKVVYSHDYFYSIDSGPLFDTMRFKKIRDNLIKMKLIHRKNVLIPEMVSYMDLELVHPREYLKIIRNPLQIADMLRLENVDPFDTHILEYFRIVTGGTLLATEYALTNQAVVFNLGGGFHHAHQEKGGGYCLINDIAVAIKKYCGHLRSLIIDLDYHQGDGNLTIFMNTSEVFTFSMHASHWVNAVKKENRDIILPDKCGGEEYMRLLTGAVPGLLASFRPEVVFFIAGSDPYIFDALGDLNLTREDMSKRNMYVFSLIKENNLPAVIVAGGGYGERSWEVYYDFIKKALNSGK